jgi:hypothetical protein
MSICRSRYGLKAQGAMMPQIHGNSAVRNHNLQPLKFADESVPNKRALCRNGTYLKPKPWLVYSKTLMHQESDYDRMTGESFRECLGGCAAGGLIRKKIPQINDLSRAE